MLAKGSWETGGGGADVRVEVELDGSEGLVAAEGDFVVVWTFWRDVVVKGWVIVRVCCRYEVCDWCCSVLRLWERIARIHGAHRDVVAIPRVYAVLMICDCCEYATLEPKGHSTLWSIADRSQCMISPQSKLLDRRPANHSRHPSSVPQQLIAWPDLP